MQVLQQKPDGSVQIELSPMTVISMAQAYGVSIKTFNRWMAPIRKDVGAKIGRYYTITQVKHIFEKLGVPSSTMQG